MIKDRLENAHALLALHPLFAKAFDYLRQWTPDTPDGRYPLIGDSLVALVQGYALTAGGKKLETHQRYLDIQYIVEGSEGIVVMPSHSLAILEPYNETKDVVFYKDPAKVPAPIEFHPGDFGIFYPYDAHKPGCSLDPDAETAVRKIVMKVLL